ncbi:MAG: hypothetical protein ABSA83_24325 [Verrucomicrobiota bacterium]|jgi:Zn-dependent M32 family carboxypeptidase
MDSECEQHGYQPDSVEAGNIREWRRHYDRATKLSTSLVEKLERVRTRARGLAAGPPAIQVRPLHTGQSRRRPTHASGRRGDYKPLLAWLRDKIHRHGSRHAPQELIRLATGEPTGIRDHVEYLRAKFAS